MPRLVKMLRFILWTCQEFSIYLLGFFIIRIGPATILTYDNCKKQDGVGAQIQRIFAIYTLADRFRLNYLHSPIISLAIHPLDNYQTQEELEMFLKKLNCAVTLQEGIRLRFDRTVVINSLDIYRLFWISFTDKIMRRTSLLKIIEPYSIVDHFPDQYSRVLKGLKCDYFKQKTDLKKPNSTVTMVVHYRRGVGGFVIQPGESISRELDFNYYFESVKDILKDLPDKNGLIVKVLSDAPDEDFYFEPNKNQEYLWKDTPRFIDGRVLVKGIKIREQIQDFGIPCEFIVGGDPLEALRIMSQAKFLIMSRSSLSYVGAILNPEGTIVFEGCFWHKPMTSWKIQVSKSSKS